MNFRFFINMGTVKTDIQLTYREKGVKKVERKYAQEYLIMKKS